MNEPLVLIPGLMADARAFAAQLTVLSRERAVMVAPAMLGERVEEMASHLLDQLPRRFALAGHGLGGILAMELLRRAPDRVMRIALLDTQPLAETPQDAAAREMLIVKARAGRLWLWTFQANLGAQRFYLREGFAEVRRTDGAGNDEGLPDIQYHWPAEAA